MAPLVQIKLEDQRAATPRPPNVAVTTAAVPVVKPLAPERYKIQFTVSRETYEQLRQAQDRSGLDRVIGVTVYPP